MEGGWRRAHRGLGVKYAPCVRAGILRQQDQEVSTFKLALPLKGISYTLPTQQSGMSGCVSPAGTGLGLLTSFSAHLSCLCNKHQILTVRLSKGI